MSAIGLNGAPVGKRRPCRPSYTRDVTALIESEIPVQAACDTCNSFGPVDLEALSARRGPDFDLWNRKSRCRFTPGCGGIVRFSFLGRGWRENMRD